MERGSFSEGWFFERSIFFGVMNWGIGQIVLDEFEFISVPPPVRNEIGVCAYTSTLLIPKVRFNIEIDKNIFVP